MNGIYTPENARVWSDIGPKMTVVHAAREILKRHPGAVFLTPDLGCRFGLDALESEHPGSFLDVGISEQTLIGAAAGLASEGRLPFAVGYAPFVTSRALDQVRVCCGSMRLPVVIVGADAGFTSGDLGPGLTALNDVACMRSIPGMTVFEPSDGMEEMKALLASAEAGGPVYVRLTGKPGWPVLHENDYDMVPGKARVERNGTDCALLVSGPLLSECLRAAEILEEKNVFASVTHFHTVKPLDEETLRTVSRFFPRAFTVEEHGTCGGFGEAVGRFFAEHGGGCWLTCLSAGERDYPPDTRRNCLERAGLTAERIAETVAKALRV